MNEKLYEKKSHGSLLFPFQHYRMVTEQGNIFVPYHWHEELEIVLVLEGKVELLLDGAKHILSPGDLVFVSPRRLHQYTSISDLVVYYAYVFPLSALSFAGEDITQTSLIAPLLEGKLCFPERLSPSQGELYQRVYDLITRIIALNEESPKCFELLTKAYLYEIIGLLGREGLFSPHPVPDKNMDTYRKILLYIEEHYAEKITVSDIARYLCMSPNYFSAYFSRHFGKSFSYFLIRYRIEKACALLASEEDCSVTQAAMQTGFENISYFIKKFKQVTGTTPAIYRSGSQMRIWFNPLFPQV